MERYIIIHSAMDDGMIQQPTAMVDIAKGGTVRFRPIRRNPREDKTMSTAGSCNGCGASGQPLMKLSLGKDFFGRPYDRLSPSADQSPKWYCEPCSMLKNLQRDFRDIRAEFEKLSSGQTSAFSQEEERQRAQLRLREIATIAEGQSSESPLLNPGEVRQFIEHFHASV